MCECPISKRKGDDLNVNGDCPIRCIGLLAQVENSESIEANDSCFSRESLLLRRRRSCLSSRGVKKPRISLFCRRASSTQVTRLTSPRARGLVCPSGCWRRDCASESFLNIRDQRINRNAISAGCHQSGVKLIHLVALNVIGGRRNTFQSRVGEVNIAHTSHFIFWYRWVG